MKRGLEKMLSKIREICHFIYLKEQVHSFEMVTEESKQVEGSFKCLPAADVWGFIKLHRPLGSLEIAERSKENGMGSKPPLILGDCTEIQGSLLVPRCSLVGLALFSHLPQRSCVREGGSCAGSGVGKVLGCACPQPRVSCLEAGFLSSICRS